MIFPTKDEALAFCEAQKLEGAATAAPTTHGYWTLVSPKHKAKTNVCSICGEEFPEFSNNARPVNEGRCCAYCDDRVVTPARIERARRR